MIILPVRLGWSREYTSVEPLDGTQIRLEGFWKKAEMAASKRQNAEKV
jgi:hypothetical protein